jgi:micrococcal nuclease
MSKRKSYFFAILFVVIIALCYHNTGISQKNTVKSYATEVSKTKTARVVRVTDGDTLVVKYNGKKHTVRLIGVDTPESVANRKDLVNTKYGKKASKYTKKKLKVGKKVYLEYDKDPTDIYGRDLAYLYMNKNKNKKTMFNNMLVKKGYARAVYYSPNGKYRTLFAKNHKKAKRLRKGFWGSGKNANEGFSLAFPGKEEKTY